jgi:hypothetical protein
MMKPGPMGIGLPDENDEEGGKMKEKGRVESRRDGAHGGQVSREFWVAWIVLLVALVALGCRTLSEIAVNVPGVVRGSGTVVTEERDVQGFNRISFTGSGQVLITQGGSESLVVETDDNLMEYIQAEVQGETLVLGFTSSARTRNLRPSESIRFHLSLIELEALDILGSGDVLADQLDVERLDVEIGGSGDLRFGDLTGEHLTIRINGSGDIRVDNLLVDDLSVDINGSGDLDLVGEVLEQQVEIDGSGTYQAGDLRSERVDIRINGSGDAEFWVTETLDVRIQGSGDVVYYGDPDVTQSTPGSGSVISGGAR